MAASIDSFFMLEALARLDGGMSQLVQVTFAWLMLVL